MDKGNIPKLSEEDCAEMAASETDNMVGLLIKALKDNGLYDNTVIVAYADHYLYTLDDKQYLINIKKLKQLNQPHSFLYLEQ